MDNDVKLVWSLIVGIGVIAGMIIIGAHMSNQKTNERCKILLEANANPITIHEVCAPR